MGYTRYHSQQHRTNKPQWKRQLGAWNQHRPLQARWWVPIHHRTAATVRRLKVPTPLNVADDRTELWYRLTQGLHQFICNGTGPILQRPVPQATHAALRDVDVHRHKAGHERRVFAQSGMTLTHLYDLLVIEFPGGYVEK
jgi:hypothetical protein